MEETEPYWHSFFFPLFKGGLRGIFSGATSNKISPNPSLTKRGIKYMPPTKPLRAVKFLVRGNHGLKVFGNIVKVSSTKNNIAF
jgi:hypothetical protein